MATKQPTPKAEAALATTSAERLAELAQDPKLTKVVAANPAAPPDLLEQLSHSADKAVRKALTSNPGTPPSVLVALGSQFPEQLLENPVFDLLLLENPNLLSELPKSTLNSLLKREVVPLGFIRWAAQQGDEAALQSLLVNPQVPADVIAQLQQHSSVAVREAAALHISAPEPDSTVTLASALHQRPALQKKDWRLEYPLLAGFLPADSVCFLQENQRRHVAKHPSCPVELLQELAKDEDIKVRWDVAGHPNCPVELLQELAKDKARRIRCGVAENPNCPMELLQELAKDEDFDVRCRVAEHPNCPMELLQELAKDEDSRYVRLCVAEHPNCPVDLQHQLLQELAKDRDNDVRLRVAEHPNYSVDLLQELAIDGLESLTSGSTPSLPRLLAFRSPHCPPAALAKNVRSRDWLERAFIAANPSTPDSTLQALTRDGNRLVRQAAEIALHQRQPS